MAINSKDYDVEAPFPARQLLTLGLCRLAEPIAFISIISYNFALVHDIKGPDNASFWAGILVSAFAISEATTSMMWGALSDRFGRKPIILIGLTGTVISSLMLGFAKTYWFALLARVAGGLLNGNVAVMQTMVAEIVKNPKHEPRAYSIQPFAWSLGSILGSALGGYAAQPARFYPQYFSSTGIFGRYPYLLPNLVAAVCITMAIVQAAFFLEETNPMRQNSKPKVDTIIERSEYDERTPLNPGRRQSTGSAWAGKTRRLSYVTGSMPSTEEPAFDVRKPSFGSVQNFKPAVYGTASSEGSAVDDSDDDTTFSSNDDESTSAPMSAPSKKIFTKRVIMWIIAISLLCYHQMAFMSAFPIWILDQPQLHPSSSLDLHGGLGLTVHDVGRYMAINSCFSLLVQAFILPIFLSKLGIFQSIAVLTLFIPLIDIAIPFISIFSDPTYRNLAVYPAFMLMATCNIIVYPAMLIMLKNATPSKKALGKVNGLAVSASSAARTIAPPLIGLFYTALGSAGAWWSCAVFGLLAICELYCVPRPKQSDQDIMRRAAKTVRDTAADEEDSAV